MIFTLARGVARGALTLAVTAAAVIGAVSAAQAAPAQATLAAAGKLSLSALSFQQTTVDSTAGAVADDLTWTVKDTGAAVAQVAGHVTIRMYDPATATFIGHDYVIPFSYGNTCCSSDVGRFVSGTPQNSTYTYTFFVPQWADARAVTWEVTKVTLEDNLGQTATVGAAKLQTLGSAIATTAAVDSAGPSVSSVSLQQNTAPMRPYAYVNGTSADVTYTFTVQDYQSGFWKGSLKLAGPGGQSVTIQFQYTKSDSSTSISCGGSYSGGDDHDLLCGVAVTLPAGSAAGNWRVAAITVFDNAGAQATFKNPQSQSVTVTSDAVVSASGFTISPNPVNNWQGDVPGTLTMSVTGAKKGISAIYVDFDNGGCTQLGGIPTVNPDGTVSVPLRTYSFSQGCTVTGIAIVDGAADVAVYGSEYNAPDPGLAIHRVPDTTPPVATAASLTPSSIPLSQLSQVSVTLTIHTQLQTAPIDGASFYLYDAAGNTISQGFGGIGQSADGTVTEYLYLPWYNGMGPGDYTVGFELTDSGGLSTYYGILDNPQSQPVPGGPLVLTVTDDSTPAV